MLLLRYKTRKLVFRGLVALYFIIATWLLLFANGFRVQLSPFTISRTGNILATFKPTSAEIEIDNNETRFSSPARIRSLFPGTHRATISADGYLPYTRSIRIEPKKTSFISNIFLLKDASPEPLSGTITEPRELSAEDLLAQTIGKNVELVTTAASGTRIIIGDNAVVSRDLGAGAWKIVGGDAQVVAVARIESDEIQFRSWDQIDTIITTLPGHKVVATEFDGTESLLAISDFEVWNFNTTSRAAELVYRFSTPIISVLPVPETTLITIALPDEITAFHLGDHHYIPTTLIRESIVSQKISEDGRYLHYSVKSGQDIKNFRRILY
jgi:hypothetical protein